MIPNNKQTRNLVPKLASINNPTLSSFSSNAPFIDTRSSLADINAGLPFLSSAPMVWTLNTVSASDLEKLYAKYCKLDDTGKVKNTYNS